MVEMSKVINWDGREVGYDSAVVLMDDGIRGGLHVAFASCFEQGFFNECLIAYYAKYGEEFTII